MDSNMLFELFMSRWTASGGYASTLCCKTAEDEERATYSHWDFYRLPSGRPVVALTCKHCGAMFVFNLETYKLEEIYKQIFG